MTITARVIPNTERDCLEEHDSRIERLEALVGFLLRNELGQIGSPAIPLTESDVELMRPLILEAVDAYLQLKAGSGPA